MPPWLVGLPADLARALKLRSSGFRCVTLNPKPPSSLGFLVKVEVDGAFYAFLILGLQFDPLSPEKH